MIWLKRQSVYHKASPDICTTDDTFMTHLCFFLSIFLIDNYGTVCISCVEILKKNAFLCSKLLFYSFKGIWQIIPTCHLTAKQSSFWVSNILKNQLHEIYPYDILIFSVICMHHAVMTYYDVNGKWRNCCAKQSILKIWIEITLFSHSPPFPSYILLCHWLRW